MRGSVIGLILLSFVIGSGPALAEEIWDYFPPKDQDSVRGQKALTVGLPITDPYNLPGQLQFRPTSQLTIGSAYDSFVSKHRHDLTSGERLAMRSTSAALYVEYYPPKAWGFHLGAGAELRSGTFSVLRKDGSGADEVVKTGEYSGVYAGPSFGWTWLYGSGVTLGFDVSKRKRFTDEVTTVTLVESSSARIDTEVKELLLPESVHGMLLLGYSF